MLLAIDVGNTHTVFGVSNGDDWIAIWRHPTDPMATEDQLAAWLKIMFDLECIPFKVSQAICASVAPGMNESLDRLCERYFGTRLLFLRDGATVDLEVDYQPKTAVGADRIANALGALDKYEPPLIVVDFGTGTTFDAVDKEGRYVGGAILPGILVSSEALFKRAAKLPNVDNIPFHAPDTAIGKNTVHSLQSGIMLGYAGAIDALANRIKSELGSSAKVVATGGLGSMFLGICESLEEFEPTLTLDGLQVANQRLRRSHTTSAPSGD